jgi:endogenous inhibitor of DNA gyrase (YacG/DUF329 family)
MHPRSFLTKDYPCPGCGKEVHVRREESEFYFSTCDWYEETQEWHACNQKATVCPHCGAPLVLSREEGWEVQLP